MPSPWELLLAPAIVASAVNYFFNYQVNRRTTFINTITTERVKWISKMREDVSELCALCNEWSRHINDHMNSERSGLDAEFRQKIKQLINKIELQLNTSIDEDNNIIKCLKRLPSWTQSLNPEEYDALEEDLIKAVRVRLESEHNLIREEVKSSFFCI